jgi:hypothetical protein
MHKEQDRFHAVVDVAADILEMHRELVWLQEERERLLEVEKKYGKLLTETIAHNDVMIGNTVKLLLTPGVVQAVRKDADKKKAVEKA